jgi:FkbM family methyltransferase
MPRAHRLSDYAALYPRYGQNLVDVARWALGSASELQLVDIGANIGDSAVQISAAVRARILCVEGDPYWFPFLDRNLEAVDQAVCERALIVTDAVSQDLQPVRSAGTTQFHPGRGSVASAPMITAQELSRRHPEFGAVRLIKSDTDGYDTMLIPTLAHQWADSSPVLFFEYDPRISNAVGNTEPDQVWAELAALGYADVHVWDNFGNALGTLDLAGARDASEVLAGPRSSRSYDYWDVAVVHRDDAETRQALVDHMASELGGGQRISAVSDRTVE